MGQEDFLPSSCLMSVSLTLWFYNSLADAAAAAPAAADWLRVFYEDT